MNRLIALVSLILVTTGAIGQSEAAGLHPLSLAAPVAVAIGAGGGVFVATAGSNAIVKVAPVPVSRWGSFGHDAGQLDGPSAVVVSRAGTVYVAGTNNAG